MGKVKNWDAVKKEADSQGGSVPDGRYRAKVESAELTESKTSGREQINLFSTIVEEGDYANQNIGVFLGLDEEKSLPWTIAALRRCGYKIEEPEDIVDVVESLNNDLPEITIRVKNGFTNLEGLFQKVGEDELGTSDDDRTSGTDDVEETSPDEDESVEEVVEEVEESVEDGDVKVDVGDEVNFEWKGETLTGTIKEINEAEGKLKISSGGKVYPVKAEAVSPIEEVVEEEGPVEEEEMVEEEPEEEPEVEVKKKKPAPKKAPAKPVKKNVKRK